MNKMNLQILFNEFQRKLKLNDFYDRGYVSNVLANILDKIDQYLMTIDYQSYCELFSVLNSKVLTITKEYSIVENSNDIYLIYEVEIPQSIGPKDGLIFMKSVSFFKKLINRELLNIILQQYDTVLYVPSEHLHYKSLLS